MIQVEHFVDVNRTPAMPLLAEGWNALLATERADPVQIINWDDEALLARIHGDAAGVLSFAHQKWDRTLFVKLGYVRTEYRRRGVYRALWERLVEIARERGVPEIHGATSVSNTDMQKTMTRLGRTVRALHYVYRVEKQDA